MGVGAVGVGGVAGRVGSEWTVAGGGGGGDWGRLARPGSERATWGWLRRRSGLGELLDFDFQTLSLMQMYRASDALMRHRQAMRPVEANRRNRTQIETVDVSGIPLPPGRVDEHRTLAGMLGALEAPRGALVVMDRGVATEDRIQWLREEGYRYVSRQGPDPASKATRCLRTDCRRSGLTSRALSRRFEQGLARLWLSRPRALGTDRAAEGAESRGGSTLHHRGPHRREPARRRP